MEELRKKAKQRHQQQQCRNLSQTSEVDETGTRSAQPERARTEHEALTFEWHTGKHFAGASMAPAHALIARQTSMAQQSGTEHMGVKLGAAKEHAGGYGEVERHQTKQPGRTPSCTANSTHSNRHNQKKAQGRNHRASGGPDGSSLARRHPSTPSDRK